MAWLEREPRARARIPPPPGDAPAVEYVSIRCPNPNCRSDQVVCYSTMPWEGPHRVRYHKCRDCACLFKSVETKGRHP